MTYVPPKYPDTIPTEADLFPWVDDKHYVDVDKFTAFVKELRAALVELGTDPAGASDTVKLRLEQIEASLTPTGIISMWSGLLANIPTGWALCDGQDGRPNLLDKFVKGVPNGSTDPGDTGGTTQHKHTQPTHDHAKGTLSVDANVSMTQRGDKPETCAAPNHSHGLSGSVANGGNDDTNKIAHLPPYYEIAYIIKT